MGKEIGMLWEVLRERKEYEQNIYGEIFLYIVWIYVIELKLIKNLLANSWTGSG